MNPRGILRDQSITHRASELKELLKLQADNKISTQDLLVKLNRCNEDVDLDNWITADPLMLKIKDKVQKIKFSQNHNSVLITGPSGTGKELLARALTTSSTPFIARNCAGFPKELISSLFFGHLKGTFTGADTDRDGLLVAAKNGVCFLDEIGDFPIELQATLLRAIQERVICRLGATTEQIPINCRFVAATKYNLRELVEQGKFREDLFARLMTFELQITGLKERVGDIPLIAEHGCDQAGNLLNWTSPLPEAIYPDIYKFNVRAIQTYVQRMITYGHYE